MTDDDDLRDGFGEELTAALLARSRAATTVQPVDTVVTVERRVHRAHGRRRVLAAAAAAVVGASATAAIVLHGHTTARVNVAAHASSTTASAPPPVEPRTSGIADWTWVSADHGWALVREPCGATVCMALRETTDGGRTWAPVRTPALLDTEAQSDAAVTCATQLCVSGVRFATPKVGWLFGPAFVETVDGGRTWKREPAPVVTDVEASGDFALRLTTSRVRCTSGCAFDVEREQLGTGAWRSVASSVSGHPSLLILRTDAYVVGVPDLAGTAGADLRRSHDGGKTWTAVADPCAVTSAGHVAISASEAPDGVFVVLCAARKKPTTPFVRISGDGGKTFGAPHDVPSIALVVRTASAQTILIGCNGSDTNVVLRSTDGGVTWRTALMSPFPTGGAVTLGWENPQTARVSLGANAIWTTRDAGGAWTKNAVAP